MATLIQYLYNGINNFIQLHSGFIYLTPVAADLVILAINAREITSAEKHIANTIYAADDRFFSMMNADGTDIETGITTAHSNFAMQSVGIAVAWTNVAGR
jgi:predicted GTPase